MTDLQPNKKPCLSSSSPFVLPTITSDLPATTTTTIGTHDGTFHCDEVLAISMLRLLPTYRDAVVVRTRDTEKLAKCDIVVDVGSEYDAARLRFDHHQRGFDQTLGEGYKTKLSSAGLVYKHFGREVLSVLVKKDGNGNGNGSGVEEDLELLLDKLYKKVYVDFMEHIDGIDNGITVAEGELRYKVDTHLPGRVATHNPAWNEDSSPESSNQRFGRAMEMATGEFVDFVSYLCHSWWPARQLVAAAFEERETVHASGQVIYLNKSYCPWADHLFELERDAGVLGLTKYVLYADAKGSMIRIHAVPEKVGSFALRLPLPEAWRGLRDDVLCAAANGIAGCTFVHANGFIGGNKTVEGALQMIDATLKM